MAKKRPRKEPPIRQQRIAGSMDLPTENVLRKAAEYVEALLQRMALQQDENALRGELIELMKADGLETFALDGHTITLVHAETNKITVKKDGDAN